VEEPVQVREHRIQGTLLGRGDTGQGHLRHTVTPHALADLLHDTRLAKTRFSTQHHDLPVPVPGLEPVLLHQRQLVLTSHQRRQPARDCHLEAALGATGTQHAIHLQRLHHPFEHGRV